MAAKEYLNIAESLKNILLSKNIFVNKIILFGSYAKKTHKTESDLDLAIVSKDFRNKNIFDRVEMVKGVHISLVDKIDKPVDLLYYSDEEWEEEDSLIISEAKQNGIVLYS